jgi:uncharacterized membrane protein YfcA
VQISLDHRRQRFRSDGASVGRLPAAAVGAGARFVSGLTGVGGGAFLTPLLITPRDAPAPTPHSHNIINNLQNISGDIGRYQAQIRAFSRY